MESCAWCEEPIGDEDEAVTVRGTLKVFCRDWCAERWERDEYFAKADHDYDAMRDAKLMGEWGDD